MVWGLTDRAVRDCPDCDGNIGTIDWGIVLGRGRSLARDKSGHDSIETLGGYRRGKKKTGDIKS